MKLLVLIPLLAALALLPACHSSSSSGGDDTDTGTGSDSDSDTDTGDSDSSSESDSASDTEQVGWHWEDLPEEIDWGKLLDIAGTGPDDVVAAGVVWIPYGVEGQTLRFDGETWALSSYDFDAIFLDVACASGDGTFHVGSLDKNPEFSIFTSDGDNWLTAVAPDLAPCDGFWFPGSGPELAGYISCLEPTGFVALYACGGSGPVDGPHYLSAFDGTTWTSLLGPDSLPEAEANVHLVHGATTDDLCLFASHDDDAPGYHFDGESLTPMTAPPWPQCEGHPHGCVFDMDGDETHGYGYYATGVGTPEGGIELQGFVWHSEDEINWSDVPVPHPPDPDTYSELFADVWLSDEGEVYVVGRRYFYDYYPNGYPFPVLLRFDGEEWEEIDIPDPPESENGEAELYGVWGTGAEVFAVGTCMDCWGESQMPAILHYVPE